MNTKRFSLLVIIVLLCFVLSTEASRRGRRRAGRRPRKSGEDPTIKFRQSVEKYKVRILIIMKIFFFLKKKK